MRKVNDKKKSVASVLEMIILITSTIAFAWLAGQSIPSVSAQEKNCVQGSIGLGGSTKTWKISGTTLTSGAEQTSVATFCQWNNARCDFPSGGSATIKDSQRFICSEDNPAPSTAGQQTQTSICLKDSTDPTGNTVAFIETRTIGNIDNEDAVERWCQQNRKWCHIVSNEFQLNVAPYTNCLIPVPRADTPPTAPAPSVIRSATDAAKAAQTVKGIVGGTATAGEAVASGVTGVFPRTAAERAAVENAKKIAGPWWSPKNEFGGTSNTRFLGRILVNAGITIAIWQMGPGLINKLIKDPELAEALGHSVAVAYGTHQILLPILQRAGIHKILGIGLGGLGGLGISLIVAGIFFIATFKKTRYSLASFTCYPWDAQTGGRDCEKCNTGDFPCTEYACKSLGQACVLDNAGTDHEICVWNNSRDVTPPVITPWVDILTTGYRYSPDDSISPPDTGVEIVPDSGECIKAFTPLRFGVTLNEPGKCKIDRERKDSFDDMDGFMNGRSLTSYNHSQPMSLPSPDSLEQADNITLQNGGAFSLYVRCQDANGNSRVDNFVFNFCVDKGPDTTAPEIVTTSILNGFPIAYDTTSTDLNVYINEPAECRWSRLDHAYDDMETDMTCDTDPLSMNARMLYKCSTVLTGLQNGENNDYYFRCRDQPWYKDTNESQRNSNSQSYKFTLKGTRPLAIDYVTPNSTTIRDATDVIKVTINAKTSAGYDEGYSTCSFSDTGEDGSFTEFFSDIEETYNHTQDLYLAAGDYTYYVSCTDLGGNTDSEQIDFSVETDTLEPLVVRAYRESGYLSILTNEESECVYSNRECSYLFEDGIQMTSSNNIKHQATWDPSKTFYIKCADEFGNQPDPNICSIVASPYTIR